MWRILPPGDGTATPRLSIASPARPSKFRIKIVEGHERPLVRYW
jgi:hypothetical protein